MRTLLSFRQRQSRAERHYPPQAGFRAPANFASSAALCPDGLDAWREGSRTAEPGSTAAAGAPPARCGGKACSLRSVCADQPSARSTRPAPGSVVPPIRESRGAFGVVARLRGSRAFFRAIVDSPTPWRDAWLAARMAGWAIVLPVMKHFVPVSTLARMMWKDAATADRPKGRKSESPKVRSQEGEPGEVRESDRPKVRESETPKATHRGRDRRREAQVVRLAGWLSRATNVTTRGACLQRSLLAYRYLSALGANPRLVLAFGKREGKAAGHAWVEVDGQAMGETAETLATFARTVTFGERGRVVG